MRTHGLVHLRNKVLTSLPDGTFQINYFADMSRVMIRYPNGIAYRDLILDYGHLLATLKKCLIYYKIDLFSIRETGAESEPLTALDLINLPFLQVQIS